MRGEALKAPFQLTKVFPLPSPCRGGSGGGVGNGAGGLGFWKLLVSSNTLWLTPRFAIKQPLTVRRSPYCSIITSLGLLYHVADVNVFSLIQTITATSGEVICHLISPGDSHYR